MNSRTKVRLSLDCSPEERKCIKILATEEGKTISEYLLSLVRDRITSLTTENNIQVSNSHEKQNAGVLTDYYKVLGY